MIKNVLTSLFAIFLFSLGAAGAWYFVQFQQQQQQAAKATEEESHEEPSQDDEKSETALASTHDEPESHESHGGSHGSAHGTTAAAHGDDPHAHTAGHGTDESMPIPVRGQAMSPEEVTRYGFMYRKNMEILKAKEEEIRRERAQLQLLYKDIDQRKLEIEGMLKQMQQTTDAAEQMLEKVQQERAALGAEKEAQKQTPEPPKPTTPATEPANAAPTAEGGAAAEISPEMMRANIEKAALIIGGLDDTKAADVFKGLANEGSMDLILKILDKIPERKAAKILSALDDSSLVAQITKAYPNFQREKAEKKRR